MEFDKATFDGAPATAAATTCAMCKRTLERQYWSVGPATLCGDCAEKLRAGAPKDGGFFRVIKALFLGSAAGLAGAIGYSLVIYFLHIEFALITIGIGWLVGRAVRMGSEGYGGRGYQVMGAVLTYVWCMMSYVPSYVAETMSQPDHLPVIVSAIIGAIAVQTIPVTGGMGALGTLILGFGVWRGWREPAKLQLVVEGPFELAPASAPNTASADDTPAPTSEGAPESPPAAP